MSISIADSISKELNLTFLASSLTMDDIKQLEVLKAKSVFRKALEKIKEACAYLPENLTPQQKSELLTVVGISAHDEPKQRNKHINKETKDQLFEEFLKTQLNDGQKTFTTKNLRAFLNSKIAFPIKSNPMIFMKRQMEESIESNIVTAVGELRKRFYKINARKSR